MNEQKILLQDGLKLLSNQQSISFARYTRTILPADGFIFWMNTGNSFMVNGSFHYATNNEQNDVQTVGKNSVVFTTTEEIDDFIRFMREEVTIEHKLDFPYTTSRRYAMELGNHMFLHYGTHAAMAEENGWKNRARMLAGRYSWQSADEGSFAEQRDNALKNVAVLEEAIGFKVKTWGVPGRDYDEETPRAVEASGMQVASDTNASAFINVLRLPAPHHPDGCNRLVELTKKYPGDPDNVFKLAMLKYWLWLAAVKRSTFIFMAHHHLLRYEGMACTGMTESFLRFVMERGGGRYYISTLYGLGTYWEKVLCPLHRCVQVTMKGLQELEITNSGETSIESIPVEVRFAKGKRMVILTDLPSNSSTRIVVAS